MNNYAARSICLLLVFATVVTGVIAAPAAEEPARVVATTSWTAAFAYAAGADSVHVLAPYEMRHPPEYELSPSDLAVISNAEVIVYAGYEGMVARIKEAVGGEGPRLVQIVTDYSRNTLETSITLLGSEFGTVEAAAQSVDELTDFLDTWMAEIAGMGLDDASVIAHLFQKPLAAELGVDVASVFGPAPLEAKQIVTLSGLDVDLIIDNYHNDVGKPLRETMPSVPVVEFVNFPGVAGTRTLLDVLEENRNRLAALLAE